MHFIHIADVHLGMEPDRNKTWSRKRQKELYESFYKVVDQCEKEQADLLLIAGDLFHRQPLVRECKEINYAFSCLTHTKVVIMAGNHDYIGEQSQYEKFTWNENVFIFRKDEMEKFYFEDLNTEIYGFSYGQREITEPLYDHLIPENNGRFHILLAHGGDREHIPVDRNRLKAAGFDYIALGHIHKPERIGSCAAYAGSLEPLDRTETGERGYISGILGKKISSDGRGLTVLQLEFIPFSMRKYIPLTMPVTPETTNRELQEQVRKELRIHGEHNIYSIVLEGLRDTQIELDTDSLNDSGQIVEIADHTVPDYDFEMLYNENRDNIIGKFINRIRQLQEEDEIADKALYYGIEALLHARE